MPYDQYCKSVKAKLKSRTCTKCGLYFASLQLLKNHADTYKVLWTKGTIAPKKILSRRDNESLVVFQSYNDEEDVEWLDDDLIEFNNEAVVLDI